ncbi:MAG: quinone-interacting membrane-bound oxidoreductase complex subunit QmoC [Desulfovibrionaceae bacterium]|jgi:quinone-modifying oxidoreductase subunit QmoC|nr:quinone-interacting membrane-bound oxidoreductase complex subunit QmoC [Desulfovibrionaceae bacterium]
MAQRIEPDLQFIKELQEVGGESLKKCYQCATCSVACPISPSANPYPRKEMVWAQWGLRDKLLNNPDIWLCHNCGTCSDLCPRGAKPGDLLAALRNMAYQRINPLPCIGKWMTSAKYLPILAGIPALLYLVLWIISANFVAGSAFPVAEGGKIVYGELFYELYFIDPVFVTLAVIVAGVFFVGVRNLIASLKPEGQVLKLGPGADKSWVCCLIDVIKEEVLTHKKFQDCGADKADRKIGHMALFYGFVCLAVVTGLLAAGFWTQMILGWVGIHVHNPFHTPMSFANPNKWLAIVGAVLLLTGLVLLTVRRLSLDPKKSASNYYDWYLLGVIWAVAVTGVLSMLLRLSGVATLAFPMYYLHLIAVFMLFAYLPWSKLGHLVYRTAALTYVRYMGR